MNSKNIKNALKIHYVLKYTLTHEREYMKKQKIGILAVTSIVTLSSCGYVVEAVKSALADLIVSSLSLSDDSPSLGQLVRLKFKVKNDGELFSRDTSTNLAVYKRNTSNGKYDLIKHNRSRKTKKLNPQEDTTYKAGLTFHEPGEYQIKSIVDLPDLVAESNEFNNSLSKAVTIKDFGYTTVRSNSSAAVRIVYFEED